MLCCIMYTTGKNNWLLVWQILMRKVLVQTRLGARGRKFCLDQPRYTGLRDCLNRRSWGRDLEQRRGTKKMMYHVQRRVLVLPTVIEA